ncbi:hypothetical protein [Saccharothrix sp. ST-888]|uniref:hypothetical protein n=1 Tax=Saccharothrix sp. ST-888 TaxID=1427391 RepID=UPI0005ECB263|nr:hypothetical protein [Saccharothrix sp. ST-888]KJK57549.1 hypothetical protein UK12_16000 [Saccharothrix sp. ST-888]
MLLTEHAEAIEADLLRYYRLDLLDYHRGAMSARRLRVLVQHLPEESALGRALLASPAGLPGQRAARRPGSAGG